MIAFPHAKINLGLAIKSKRPDGFHNLESVFYPIPLTEVVEIIPSAEFNFIQSGLVVSGDSENNLLIRAYRLLKADFPQIGPLHIYLHKIIPVGAGLGGGSSDAAAMLKLIIRLNSLPVSDHAMHAYALALGSDCPFFLQNDPCFVSGRGELLERLSLDLSAYSFLLVHPEIKISTAWAFSRIQPSDAGPDLKNIVLGPIQNWKAFLVNHFELPVFQAYPDLAEIKTRLYESGALYASMSGSGSSFYGIFNKGKLPDLLLDRATQTLLP